MADGGQDAHSQQDGREEVADARPGLDRLAVGGAGDAEEPANRLGDDVEGGPGDVGTFTGAGIAETTNGGVDEAGVDVGKPFVAEVEPLHHPGSEVLGHDVGKGNELQELLPPVRRLEIEHDAALATVDRLE